jgi:hypothetical protein
VHPKDDTINEEEDENVSLSEDDRAKGRKTIKATSNNFY